MSFELNSLGQPVGPIVANWREPPWPSEATMFGNYCRLERLQPTLHAAPLFEAYQADDLSQNWTYLAYGPFREFAGYRDWIERQCELRDPMFFAIIDETTNAPTGVASYLRITPASGSIEVGHINYSPRLQRTRAATEAMYLMMARAFELGYRRYEWKCDALNMPSRTAANRLGFSFEGIFRQATIVKGRNRDTAWYAVVDQQWPALRTAFMQWLAPDNFDAQGRQRQSLAELTAPIRVPTAGDRFANG